MSGYDWFPLVEVLAEMDGLAARLLERHHDDGSGRCRVCGSGGQTGRYRWPCATRELAVLALARQAELRLATDFPAPPARHPDAGRSPVGPRAGPGRDPGAPRGLG